MPLTHPVTPGRMLRFFRRRRSLSQHRLALASGVSARHLSFLESGRSLPGRDVLVRIGRALELSSSELNRLLVTAGYASLQPIRPLDHAALDPVRHLLTFLLERHEPYGAVVVDRAWNVLLANRAHRAIMGIFAPESPGARGEPSNLVHELFSPSGLRPAVANFPVVASVLFRAVSASAAQHPFDPRLQSLAADLEEMEVPAQPTESDLSEHALWIPIELARGPHRVSLVSTITTFAAPLDATVEELRLETFLPLDDESRRTLERLASRTEPPS